jgi:hypothetical protein
VALVELVSGEIHSHLGTNHIREIYREIAGFPTASVTMPAGVPLHHDNRNRSNMRSYSWYHHLDCLNVKMPNVPLLITKHIEIV